MKASVAEFCGITVAVMAALAFMVLGFLVLRLHWVDAMRDKIYSALCKYTIFCLKSGITPQVKFGDMEYSGKTYNRLWDWGYKRILPKEKFEIIKEFIE